MDGKVYQGIFGSGQYCLATGSQLRYVIESATAFTVQDGMLSLQGRQVMVEQTTLPIAICPAGQTRIDLVVIRYELDTTTNIESATLMVIQGTAVASSSTPTEPTYNTGVIDDGATIVDFPVYALTISGSTVTANRRVNTLGILKQDRFITSNCTLTRSSGITGTTFSDLQVYRSGGTLGISFRVNTGSATGVAGNKIIVGALTIPGWRVVTGAAASTFNGSLSAVCLLGAGTTPTVIMRATSNTAANTYYSVNLTAVCVEV